MGTASVEHLDDLGAFIAGISFAEISPTDEFAPWCDDDESPLGGLHHLKVSAAFEVENTRFPGDMSAAAARLEPLLRVPRMSSYAIAVILNQAVRSMPATDTFVNVGLWHGFTFLAGLLGNADRSCVGVDNFSEFGGPERSFKRRFERHGSPNHRFYEMDFVKYFEAVHAGSIGVYLYDADHSYESQLHGLRVAEPYFSPGCIVLVDDVNFDEVGAATREFTRTSDHSYEWLLDVKTAHGHHPTFWNGLTVLRRA